MTNKSLLLDNVSIAFGDKEVLKNISFELPRGSVTGLLGKNGAGKTTLMKIALGLLRPDQGSVNLLGISAWDSPAEVRRRIGYVAQMDTPYYWMRVRDCLTLVGSFYDSWDAALIDRYLREWDIDRDAYIQDLSFGQRQKVCILLAIGHRPELLVLDEPVASLDPGARRQFLKALVSLNQDLEHTILFSTHITSDLERIAADVALLHCGTLTYRGNLDELKERCRRLYFVGDNLPESFEHAGIERYQNQQGRASAFTRNWDQAENDALAKSMGIRIEEESLPLEELFLELTLE